MQFSPNSASLSEQRTPIFILLAILGFGLFYSLILMPFPSLQAVKPYLNMNGEIYQSVTNVLWRKVGKLMLPYGYEPERIYWSPTMIFFVYFGQKFFGGIGNFIIFYSIFIASVFYCSLRLSSSLLFATCLTFLFAFGTQLDYLYVFGNLIALYLVLTYIVWSFYFLVMYLDEARSHSRYFFLFFGMMIVTALSNEMWINYATGLFLALVFGVFWAMRHGDRVLSRRLTAATLVVLAVLFAYLAIRMQYVSQYLAGGAEEELIVTYKNKSLFFDDAIVNFFSLLHMSVSNYFPVFLTSSSSHFLLDAKTIIAEQHGYHPQSQHFTTMSHLFMWRFYAGVYATIFCGALFYGLYRAWDEPNLGVAIAVGLALIVVGAFSTHLSIKMRPYNSFAALPYKVIVSVTAWSALLAYLLWSWHDRISGRAGRTLLIGATVLMVLSAAMTRPGMHRQLLAEIGMLGHADPLAGVARLLGK